ncbi:hypothetical protein NMG60_11000380 [Bertholletia excelsa]
MVFSSIPAYLDPSNWQQQQQNPQTGTGGGNPQPPLPPQQLPPPHPHGAGSIRPGSMADRARMANIPMPEAALKCPRCESTNTKFCYFNNYSLSQPRHFCKTCRRYWTRGGALRNVPVGGGCRRNRRSKGGSSSKSPASSGSGSGGTTTCATSSTTAGAPGVLNLSPQIPPLRFMAPLSQLGEFGSGDVGLSNYTSISAPLVASSDQMSFQMGSSSLGSFMPAGDPWRLQPTQISSLAGLDLASAGLYPFQGGVEPGGYGTEAGQVRPKLTGSALAQMGSVKMEENNNNQELNLSRPFLGIQGSDNQFWGGSAWTDLSGFSSSSTTNPL